MFHNTVGPARTTVADICRKAGIQRATFYRHFPDELSLFKECRAFAINERPMPDPDGCVTIADPIRRMRSGLATAYAFYREHEQGMAAIIRDSEVMPVGGGFFQFADRLRDVMAAGWTARGKRHARILAACGHAADFQAWRSLARKQRRRTRGRVRRDPRLPPRTGLPVPGRARHTDRGARRTGPEGGRAPARGCRARGPCGPASGAGRRCGTR